MQSDPGVKLGPIGKQVDDKPKRNHDTKAKPDDWYNEGMVLKSVDGRLYRVMKNGEFRRIKMLVKKDKSKSKNEIGQTP